MAFDVEGRLYIATGGPGGIYRIANGQKPELFFKSDEQHIRALAFDGAGNLLAGSDGTGLVYKIDKTGKETILYSFTGNGADFPPVYAALALDEKGNIYGTTPTGGSENCGFGCGAVWMLDLAGKNNILHEFSGGAEGATPGAGVTLDSVGNIYGTTGAGGDLSCGNFNNAGCGTVFKLTR